MRFFLLSLMLFSAGQALAETESSGPIDTPKPFTLMVITEYDGNLPANRLPMHRFEQWAKHPQTTEMARWSALCTLKVHHGVTPIVREHHSDILRASQGLPIIALVDSKGGKWCQFDGATLPQSEYELARKLDVYYAAVMQAAREAGAAVPLQTVSASELEMMTRDDQEAGFNLLPRMPVRPYLNQDPNSGFGLGIETRLSTTTLIGIGAIALFSCVSLIVAAWIIGEAITDDE